MNGPAKVLRDFTVNRGRTLTLVFALAVGAIAFFATLRAYGTLTREIRRAYVDSVPASATLELSSVNLELLDKVRLRPEIAAATRRRTLHGRFRSSAEEEWQNALIFAADDFQSAPLAKLGHERGALSPADGTVLVERSALPLLNGDIGSEFELKLPGGAPKRVSISGVVHEAALAPAKTHQSAYLYASSGSIQSLGGDATFDELRILLKDQGTDRNVIAQKAQALGAWIADNHLAKVHEIRVPPPERHPHQTQMTTVLAFLLVFSGVVFVMSALLASSLLSSLLARQVREIGVLKTLGATGAQVTRWYALAMLTLSTLALAVAWFPGKLGADAWTSAVAGMLNFDLVDRAAPSWMVAWACAAILLLPVLAALPSIRRAARVPVHQTLREFGLGATDTVSAPTFVDRALGRAVEGRIWLAYALRNVLRQPGKLRLAVSLLALSGGVTIAAFSVADSWQAWAVRLRSEQVYDIEVVLADSAQLAQVELQLRTIPGVESVEAWGAVPTSLVVSGFPLRSTYPDDAHGSFTLFSVPPESNTLRVQPTQGRWLLPTDTNALVLNQTVPGQAQIPVGSAISLFVEGKSYTFTVVGKMEQVGVGAAAYVNASGLNAELLAADLGGRLRVRTAPWLTASQDTALRRTMEQRLAQTSARVVEVVPLGIYENAMVAHFEVLVNALLALAALTALVGALGLSSNIAVSVLERTRELGVLRAVGAGAAQLQKTIVAESVLVGAFSLFLALPLGAMLSLGLGTVIGRMSFALPLPFTPSVVTAGAWSVAVIVLSALAGALPARRAAQITVRDAISQV